MGDRAIGVQGIGVQAIRVQAIGVMSGQFLMSHLVVSGHHCFYPDAASAPDFHCLVLQKQWFLKSHQTMSQVHRFKGS